MTPQKASNPTCHITATNKKYLLSFRSYNISTKTGDKQSAEE